MFSGLAPGFAGLYQVNAVVADGLAASANVPVILNVPIFQSASHASAGSLRFTSPVNDEDDFAQDLTFRDRTPNARVDTVVAVIAN